MLTECVIVFIGLLECQTVVANGICPGQFSVNGTTGFSTMTFYISLIHCFYLIKAIMNNDNNIRILVIIAII